MFTATNMFSSRSRGKYVIFALGRRWLKPYFHICCPVLPKFVQQNCTLQHVRVSWKCTPGRLYFSNGSKQNYNVRGWVKPVSHCEINHPGLATAHTGFSHYTTRNLARASQYAGLHSVTTAMRDVFRHDLHNTCRGRSQPAVLTAFHWWSEGISSHDNAQRYAFWLCERAL
jgi:hypothetical protein